MALDAERSLSRRALVTGTLGALGGTLLGILARPLPVQATQDHVVYLNDETDTVVLDVRSKQQPGFVQSGEGIAIRGESATTAGVWGVSHHSTGVVGEGGVTDGIGVEGHGGEAGVSGRTSTGDGVFGYSSVGRGGSFTGLKAQVRLVPGAADTHPHYGSAGDLFVDSKHRLWFCKGGTRGDVVWVKLA